MNLRLRELRLARGLRQVDLAEQVGTHQGTLSAWEHGRHLPAPPALLSLARALGVTVDELFTDDEGAA